MTISPQWSAPPDGLPAHPPPNTSSASVVRRPCSKLWLALHFHELPLAAVGEAHANGEPVAVCQVMDRLERIVTVSPGARRAGIRVMMRPGEARVICPDLRLLPREPVRERELLEDLAETLGEFSSEVSRHDELTLLMEAGRSLRLFGGAGPLIERIGGRLHDAPGHCHAMAPAPLAAALCARAGMSLRIEEPDRLQSALGDIPVALFHPDKQNLRLLDAMGVRVMRDLFRLPRQGLTRRFGVSFTRRLARLLASDPDIPPPHAFRRRFCASLHLDEETTDLALVMPAARRLLDDLEQQLRQHDSAVQELSWTINAGRGNEQLTIPMQFAAPVQRADALSDLFGLRLETVSLAAPVRILTLETNDFLTRSALQQQHIPGLCPVLGKDHQFLDRLRSRLGDRSIRGLRTLPEHRPEYSWATCEPGKPCLAYTGIAARPLWLLETPRQLALRDGRPCLNGPLRLRRDRERVRSGWWDGRPVERDYRQALTPENRRLWVFHDLAADTWHLHGLY